MNNKKLSPHLSLNVYDKRLLNVAKALRESKNPEDFTMGSYGHECGTPTCALGHYASRPDLQNKFILTKYGRFTDVNGDYTRFECSLVLRHFQISYLDAEMLFGPDGCWRAQTAIEAALFIETFVADRVARRNRPLPIPK